VQTTPQKLVKNSIRVCRRGWGSPDDSL